MCIKGRATALAGHMRHLVARSGRREAPAGGKAVIRSLRILDGDGKGLHTWSYHPLI